MRSAWEPILAYRFVIWSTMEFNEISWNMQNIPRKSFVKSMFTVPDDCVFVNTDYKTLEVVVAAILSGDEEMQRPFRENADFHSQTTDNVFAKDIIQLKEWTSSTSGICYSKIEEYLARPIMLEVRDYITKDYLHKEDGAGTYAQIYDYLRFLTKFVTFGVLYGRKAKSLAEGELNCDILEAQLYIDNFLAKYPQFHQWALNQEQFVFDHGYVITPFKFKRRWPIIETENSYKIYNQAVNSPIQSTAAQITLITLAKLHGLFKQNQYGRILFTVHDSITFQIKKKHLNESLTLIQEIMCEMPEEMNTDLPLNIDIEIGKNYGELLKVTNSTSGIWVSKKQKDAQKFLMLTES